MHQASFAGAAVWKPLLVLRRRRLEPAHSPVERAPSSPERAAWGCQISGLSAGDEASYPESNPGARGLEGFARRLSPAVFLRAEFFHPPQLFEMKPYDNKAWLLVLPALAIMTCVGILPLVAVTNYSFLDIFDLRNPTWVGVDWYRNIVISQRFYGSLGRSCLFSAIILSVQMPLGIWIALLLHRSNRYIVSTVLVLVTVPLVVPWNMIPVIWLNFINPGVGLAGRAMAWLGIGFDYKFTALHTWIVLIVMDTWHWLGLVVVLSYAGISSVPSSYYQAAAIDGASRWQIFRFIQLPKMQAVLSMALLLRFMDSFMIYIEAFRINAGGPDGATSFLSLDLGEDIQSFNYGPAAARSIVYFLIVMTVAWAFRTATSTRKPVAAELVG
jgi:glycerol transport system permease protein